MRFTGERVIPDDPERHDLYIEHLARYQFAAGYARGKRVLDIGCGCGYGTALLSRHSRFALGVDLSMEAVRYARQHYQRERLVYAVMDARELALPACCFDLAVSFEFIEHIHEQERFLHQVTRLLETRGLFIVSTPNVARYFTETGEENKYHQRELTLVEFSALLNDFFADVQMAGQRETVEFINHWQAHEYMRIRLADLEERFERQQYWLRHPGRALLRALLPGLAQRLGYSVAARREATPSHRLPVVPPLRAKQMQDIEISAAEIDRARFYIAICAQPRRL